MKFSILVICSIALSCPAQAQKYITRSGITTFAASEKSFEPVEATNKSTTVILNSSTGAVAAQVMIAGFQFKNALMQEHFNENYMDSHKYPKATFKGTLKNYSVEKSQKTTSYDLSGTLTIKGVSKPIHTTVYLKPTKNNKLHFTTKFVVQAEDYGIRIPSIVRKKIAEKILITIDYTLYEKK